VAEVSEAQLIRPVLEALADGEVRRAAEVDALVEEKVGLGSGELRREGSKRLHWVKGDTLQHAGCVEKIGKDGYRITQRGRAALRLLADRPDGAEPPSRRAFNHWLEEQGIDGAEVAGPKWEEAIALCRQTLTDRDRFDRDEVHYKRVIAERARAVLDAATGGAALQSDLFGIWRAPNNLLFHIDMSRFAEWIENDEEGARQALSALQGNGSPGERVESFAALVPREVLQNRAGQLSFASVFLLGVDPALHPPLKVTPFRDAERILDWPDMPADATVGQEYEHHLAFLDGFREKLVEAGLDVRDMLDAQGLLWVLMTSDAPEYRAFRGEVTEPTSPTSDGPPSELDRLARELYVDEEWLREVVDLLEDKRQLILYGPPGTGKTYIARELASFLTGDDPGRADKVQFHPSYSYEDFVQGYRPKPGPGGSLSYELSKGPLVRISDRARERLGETHILLIDEINRGNLPRIFGELLYLLEYRDEEVALMYGEEGAEHFSLPTNLWVLGTMNTADRSIGLIDAALRRRFHFVSLFPGEPPLDGLLARWLSKKAPSMTHVATYVDRLNARLRERFGRHLQVGHSYFMIRDLDEAKLERIWKADIMPFLEDQLFGHEDELETFSLDAIRSGPAGISPAVPDEPGDADDQAEGIRAED
jgi:5-methylcytosine-specific restriction enzyme B